MTAQLCGLSQSTGQRAAGVLVVAVHVAQVPGGHPLRVAVAVVAPQESLFVTAVAGHRRAGQAEEPLGDLFVVHILASGQGVQVAVDLLGQPVAGEHRAADKQRILQVDLVLLVVAVVGELGIAGQGQAAGGGADVGHPQRPHLIGAAVRHIVGSLGRDTGLVGQHAGVAHAVTAAAAVVREVLAHRLPGGGPEIAAVVVPQVEIAPRLVELVEHIAQDAPVGARPRKAVPARIV